MGKERGEKRRRVTPRPAKKRKRISFGSFFPLMTEKKRGEKRRRVRPRPAKKRKRISFGSSIQDCNIAREDCISQLPDDILFSILSLLTLREAARTSILCRRWKFLWTSLSNLILDVKNMTGNAVNISSYNSRYDAVQLSKQQRFVRWVNRLLLKQNTCVKILSCTIAYPLGIKYRRFVYKWVQYLANKGVEELDIDLSTFGIFSEVQFFYPFPIWCFTLDSSRSHPLKRLSLEGFTIYVPPIDSSSSFSSIHFNNLVSLTLKRIRMLHNGAMDNIFSTFLSLEHLHISQSFFPPHIKIAPNPRRSNYLKLKYLNLDFCYWLKTVEIHNAVDLVSFEHGGCDFLSKISLIDSAQPQKLSFCSTHETSPLLEYTFGDLVVDFPLVERLRIRFPQIKDNMVPKQLPTFSMLTELDLIVVKASCFGLFELTSSLLAASPLLCRLLVHLPRPIDEEPVGESISAFQKGNNSFRHEQLKDVEIVGFCGHDLQLELVFYMLRIAVNLQKLKIVRQGGSFFSYEKWEEAVVPCQIELEQVHNLFAHEVADNTEFVVL